MSQKSMFGPAVIALVLLGCYSGTAAGSLQGAVVTGVVYDIDYLGESGWSQVLLRGGVVGSAPITKSPLIQRVVEVALISGQQVRISVDGSHPPSIQDASVSAGQRCTDRGCVESILCGASNGCSARINGQPEQANTTDPQALGVLLTAMIKGQTVEYLTLGKGGVILRVKINIP